MVKNSYTVCILREYVSVKQRREDKFNTILQDKPLKEYVLLVLCIFSSEGRE